MRSTTLKCVLPSNPRRLLLAIASIGWLSACGDDDPKPPSDVSDAAATGDTIAADAAATDDTSSIHSTDTSGTSSDPPSGTVGDAGPDGDASADAAVDASPDVTSEASSTDDTTSTEETSIDESSTEESSIDGSSTDGSTDVSDAGADAGDAATDAGDFPEFPWDAGDFAIARDEVRVLADFDTDGDQSDGLSIIAPNVGFFGQPAVVEGLAFEIANSVGHFTVPFTEANQALRVQFALPGNYATHNLRVRLRIVEALPNNSDANPTLQLFSYSGGGKWNSLGLAIELGVWREYTYDLWAQPVVPEELNSAGFRLGAGSPLTEADSFVVDVDWVRLEPKP